jgi:hypothetical protein
MFHQERKIESGFRMSLDLAERLHLPLLVGCSGFVWGFLPMKRNVRGGCAGTVGTERAVVIAFQREAS